MWRFDICAGLWWLWYCDPKIVRSSDAYHRRVVLVCSLQKSNSGFAGRNQLNVFAVWLQLMLPCLYMKNIASYSMDYIEALLDRTQGRFAPILSSAIQPERFMEIARWALDPPTTAPAKSSAYVIVSSTLLWEILAIVIVELARRPAWAVGQLRYVMNVYVQLNANGSCHFSFCWRSAFESKLSLDQDESMPCTLHSDFRYHFHAKLLLRFRLHATCSIMAKLAMTSLKKRSLSRFQQWNRQGPT